MKKQTDIPVEFYDHMAFNEHETLDEAFTIPWNKEDNKAVLVRGQHHKQVVKCQNRFDGFPHPVDFDKLHLN